MVVAAGLVIALLATLPNSAAVERRTSESQTGKSETTVSQRPASTEYARGLLNLPGARRVPVRSGNPSVGAPGQSLTSSASDYSLPWYSFTAGGVTGGTSPTHALGGSVGQPIAGAGSSNDHWLGLGFWTGASGCLCPLQGDFDEDTFITVLDLGMMIDVLFANGLNIQDPNCPTSRLDFDCNGYPDALDLGDFIDHLFANGPPPCNPCAEM
jgi:hypothetical protein